MELIWKGKKPWSLPDVTDQTGAQSASPSLITQQYYYPQQEAEGVPTGWYNRLIQGERGDVLSALQNEFANAVNLIYIDPPFMTGRTFSNGTQLAYRDTWNNSLETYLQWLYETLQLLYTLLAPDGSLYIHLDWRTSHYAKILLDEIFASSTQGNGPGFKNEIIWYYQSGGKAQRYYARKHDTILLYTKSAHYCFHAERVAQRRGVQKRNHMRKEVDSAGRISWSIRSGERIYTYSEDSLMGLADVWSDISHLHQRDPERTGYATQKPEALLERVLLASSEEQDLVLDCFCGSGVMPVVAERLGRRWIACDQSHTAISTTCERIQSGILQYPFATLSAVPVSDRPTEP